MVYLKCQVYYALKILLHFINFPIDKIFVVFSRSYISYIYLIYLMNALVKLLFYVA